MGKALALLTLALGVPTVATATGAATSTLRLEPVFVTDGLGVTPCPSGTPPATDCYSQTARASVRGLGSTTLQSSLQVDQTQPGCEHLALLGSLASSEGTVSFTATSGARCVQLHQPSQVDYSVGGGGAAFAGASGTGTITLSFVSGRSGDAMKYSWHGELVVPGYSFDTTPPVFTGARDRLVRLAGKAKRARVTYTVTATDAGDGAVRSRCRPAPGSWFKRGRTTVRCAASDRHANVATARFRVTVK